MPPNPPFGAWLRGVGVASLWNTARRDGGPGSQERCRGRRGDRRPPAAPASRRRRGGWWV